MSTSATGTHTESSLLTRSGARLFVQSWRPDQPRAAVALAHGLGEHSGRYPHLVDELTRRGYAVTAVDHRGHGRTAGTRAAITGWEDFREGIAALLQQIAATEPDLPRFLYGHSLGGLIAADYAIRHPEGLRGLVLSAPALSSAGVSPALVLASRLLSRVAPELRIANGLPVAGISRDPEVQAAYTSDPLNHGYGTPRLATESFATIAWVQANARAIKLPLLIIHGEADPIVPPESSARFFTNAGSTDKQRIAYPGVVHEPHNDLGWGRAVADVGEWLDGRLDDG
jgi:alpha-beta hydrolase superfamily lysophospholipase